MSDVDRYVVVLSADDLKGLGWRHRSLRQCGCSRCEARADAQAKLVHAVSEGEFFRLVRNEAASR